MKNRHFEALKPPKNWPFCVHFSYCYTALDLPPPPPTIVTLLRLTSVLIVTLGLTSPPPSIVRVTYFVRLLLGVVQKLRNGQNAGRGVKSLRYARNVLGGDRSEKCVTERGGVKNLRFWRYVISGRPLRRWSTFHVDPSDFSERGQVDPHSPRDFDLGGGSTVLC